MSAGEEVAGDSYQVGEPDEKPSGRRALPEGADRHPLIDLSRDPNPGRPDHAKPDEE